MRCICRRVHIMAIGTVPAATLIFAGIIGFSAGNQAWSEGRLHRGWLAAGPAESVTDAVTVLGASPHIPKGATAHGAHKLLFSSLPRSCCSSFCFDVTYEVAKRRRNTALGREYASAEQPRCPRSEAISER